MGLVQRLEHATGITSRAFTRKLAHDISRAYVHLRDPRPHACRFLPEYDTYLHKLVKILCPSHRKLVRKFLNVLKAGQEAFAKSDQKALESTLGHALNLMGSLNLELPKKV